MVDQKKIEQAVKLLLEGIGEDVTREGLVDTPNRVARMYGEICRGIDEDPSQHLSKTFAVQSNEIVLEKDITFYSTCEHHLMPFYGKVHIAYLPDGRVAGLSKLARTAEVDARRLQIQEQMAVQNAEAAMEHLKPRGGLGMVAAEHKSMTMRGVAKTGRRTVTTAARGCFQEDEQLHRYFYEMVRLR